MKQVPSVYTHSMKTIYLSLREQVAEGNISRKSPECLWWGGELVNPEKEDGVDLFVVDHVQEGVVGLELGVEQGPGRPRKIDRYGKIDR